MRGLVAAARTKKDLREILAQPEWLGGDTDAAEKILLDWIRARKADPRGGLMRTGGPGQGPAPML
jgi:hypothetical protein